jgi:hypothetical protein
MAYSAICPKLSLINLPNELVIRIFNLLPDSKDAVCLALVHSTLRTLYFLTTWSSLPVDVRSLRCRLHRDLKNSDTETLYYCSRCTSARIPCEKHGVDKLVGMAKRAAFRRVVNSSRDPPLRERWLRIATDYDQHRYCCITRG